MWQFIDKVKNVVRWLPIIWKDRDFDSNYLLDVMRFKISNMETFFLSNDTHILSADKVAKDLKICKLLLNRLTNDDYYDIVFKNHDKKWGETKWEFVDDGKGLSRLLITRNKVITDEDKKREGREFLRLCEHEEMLKRQDIRYLFHIMNRKLRTWWD